MALKFLYLSAFVLFLNSCDLRQDKKKHKLVKHVVYAIIPQSDSLKEKPEMTVNTDTSYIEYIFKKYDLVNIKSLDSGIHVNLRYADTSNFLRRNFYDGLQNAYFNCETATRICAAQYYLKQINPNLSLLILDASRPQHVQQMMWDSLKLHPDKKTFYLASPEETSMHNYGCAVDVTIIDLTTQKPLDMGTDFDFFGNLAEPIYEIKFLKSGLLSQQAYNNRKLLRFVMQRARLNPITSEWWHFSICKKEEAVAKYALIR